MRTSIRLPLQVGTTASWSLLRAGLGLVPGAVLLAVTPSLHRGGDALGTLAAAVAGAFLSLYGLQHVFRAWRARPGDAVLDEQGVRFEGGRLSGVALAWTDLDPAGCAVEDTRDFRLSITRVLEHAAFWLMSSLLSNGPELAPEERFPPRRLRLRAKDGREWEAAYAEKAGEQQSLDALWGSIRARLGVESKPAPASTPGILVCASCRAPLVPEDAPQATCRFCGATTPLSSELREKVKAQQALAAAHTASSRLVDSLLVQPGAGRAARWLAFAAVGIVAGWSASLAPLFVAGLGNNGVFEVGVALVAGMLVAVALVSFSKLGLVDRRALRLLTTSFGARAPADPRGAPECRRCHAPLPATDRTVAGCAYCGADNVLGVDLRADVAPAKAHQQSLQQLFASKQRQRSRTVASAVVTLAAGGAAGFLLLMTGVVSADFRAQVQACEAGDAKACTGVATDYALGTTVAEDDAKAVEYARRACDLKDGEGCAHLADHYRFGDGVEEDREQEAVLRKQACTLGYAPACEPSE